MAKISILYACITIVIALATFVITAIIFTEKPNKLKKIIYTNNAPEPIGPYSQAIEAGGFIFISGQIAMDPASGNILQTTDIKEETEQVMKNMQTIIEAAGCTMQDVVKCTIFLIDMQQFAAVNSVYGEYFQTNPPARETVQVSALPKSVNVEISAVVWKR